MLIYFAITFVISCSLTGVLVLYFRRRHLGQYIREDGPSAHLGKKGTPTMGGLAIMIGIIAGVMCSDLFKGDKAAILLTMTAFGVIGFLDDYEKMAKRNNLGLSAKQKIILQLLFSVGIALFMKFKDVNGTEVFIPFAKVYINMGWLFIPFVMFVEVSMSNAVNLTDGLDGLAAGTTSIVAISIFAIGIKHGDELMQVMGVVTAAALLGFLVFNKHPARIFMGDTGSMALGGLLSAVAIVTRTEFLLPLVGLIYVLEVLSVIIQVIYFKKTGGKRFFRMAPLHHHFELGGMKEQNVVLMFCALSVICGGIAYIAS